METNIDDLINRISNIDPLGLAEQLVKSDGLNESAINPLGFVLVQEKAKQMNLLMDMSDDTKFSEKTNDYIRKIESAGFEIIYNESFKTDKGNTRTEYFYIAINISTGVLLTFDTHHGSRNAATMYYNWKPNRYDASRAVIQSGKYQTKNRFPIIYDELLNVVEIPSSIGPEPVYDFNGGENEEKDKWNEYIKRNTEWNTKFYEWMEDNNLTFLWIGHHDAREAIKYNLRMLMNHGTLLPIWKETDLLHLNHYGDYEIDRKNGNGYSFENSSKRSNERFEKIKLILGEGFFGHVVKHNNEK